MKNKYEVRLQGFKEDITADGWYIDEDGSVLHFYNAPEANELNEIVMSYSLRFVIAWAIIP